MGIEFNGEGPPKVPLDYKVRLLRINYATAETDYMRAPNTKNRAKLLTAAKLLDDYETQSANFWAKLNGLH